MLRKFSFALLGTLLGSTLVMADDWADKMFEVRTHDFGTVARGAKAEFEFVLTNVYEGDIHIAGVRSSCGCTTPRVATPLLKTYEKGAIVATFNTDRFVGTKGATLTVTIDRPQPAEVQLRVDGVIRSDVSFTPGSVQLGTVDQGVAAAQKVVLNFSGSDRQAIEVRSANPHLKGTLTAWAPDNSGQVNYEVAVELDKQAPAGYLRDQLMVVTNDPQMPQIPLAVEGRVVSSVTVSPASLFLGVVQPGQKVTKQLVVQGKRAFRIKTIACGDPSFKFVNDGAEKPLHLIPIAFEAGNANGPVSCLIRITTNLGDMTVELPATALVTRTMAAQ